MKFINRSLYLAVLMPIALSATEALARGKCDFSLADRVRLTAYKSKATQVLADQVTKLMKKPEPQEELRLALSFEESYTTLFGHENWNCNQPNSDEIERFDKISQDLQVGPGELRNMVRDLVDTYPDELLKVNRYINYTATADLLEAYTRSGANGIDTFMYEAEVYKEEFLRVLRPNRVVLSAGLLPSIFSINLPGKSPDGRDRLDVLELEIDSLRRTAVKLGGLGGARSVETYLEIVDRNAVTLVNDTIIDYALLYSVGIGVEVAAEVVTAELRTKGHGSLREVAQQLEKYKSL